MIYALDTNIIIDLLRGNDPGLAQKYLALKPRNYAVPEMVRAELLYGAVFSAKRDENIRLTEAFLSPLLLTPFAGEACMHYAEIKTDLKKRGLPIGPNDLVIAATVRAHGHTLITRNTSEFKQVKGLAQVAW